MTRGRKRQAPALAVITGNPGKRKLPKATPAPAASRPPAPPTFLCQDGKNEWKRIVPKLHRLGIIDVMDRSILAAYCQAYGRWLQAERGLSMMAKNDPNTSGLVIRTSKGTPVQNPLVGTANKAAADMAKYASELGLTPSARARLEIGLGNPQENPSEGARRFFK